MSHATNFTEHMQTKWYQISGLQATNYNNFSRHSLSQSTLKNKKSVSVTADGSQEGEQMFL